MIFNYNNEDIQISIQRSKRKTAVIRILADGCIEVRGPRAMSDRFVREFLQAKAEWIIQKREEVFKQQAKKVTHTYACGDEFLFQGKPYVLTLVAAGRKRIELQGNQLQVYTTSFEPQKIEAQLKQWYKVQAERYIPKRVEYYRSLMPGNTPAISGITMENRKTRWGSCSSLRELTFSWRLMMAPPEITDYVVVHELCHLLHMDHSPVYWKTVEHILPDYKERRQWLKENGIAL